MEVDHFDPREKDDYIQRYENLFLATRHCNLSKGNHWPTAAERAEGLRFLNPCEEQDYGAVIFEDPGSHRLTGSTPAAVWHIRRLSLNAAHLVEERRRRAELFQLMRRGPLTVESATLKTQGIILQIMDLLNHLIPEIAPPPGG